MQRLIVGQMVALSLFLGAISAVPAQERTWTDATSKHKVQAEFVDLSNDIVRLRKLNRSIISLPLAKLSKKDQDLAVVLGTYATTFHQLRSNDQAERVAAASGLLGKDLPAEAVPAILDYIRLEIAQLAAVQDAKARVPVEAVPFSGDELSLSRLEADPSAFLDEAFIIVGGVSPSSYYNFGYDNAEATHYSLSFREVKEDLEFTRESATLYVPRTFSGLLVDRVVRAKEAGKSGLLIRVKAKLNSRRYEGARTWDLLELVDWQLFDRAANQWKPWALDGFYAGLALLENLNDAKALVGIIGAEIPHGPSMVDHFVRTLCAKRLSVLTVPYDQIEIVAGLVVAKEPLGETMIDASIRHYAIEALAKLDRKGTYRATRFLKAQSLRAARSSEESVLAWANKASSRIAASSPQRR